MLMGEHAVVFGEPCIVTAVDQRLYVTAQKTDDGKITVNAPQAKETKFVDASIAKFFSLKAPDIDDRGVSLSIRSDFTSQVGFGSSSAVSVATLMALGLIFEISMTQREIFDLAYQVTLDIQGVGSGFDIAAATFGGTLFFKKGGEVIEPLPNEIPLVVGYTGVKADTPTLVRMVIAKQKKYPEKIDRIFEAIGKLVLQGKEALLAKDWEKLGKLMSFDQEYLRDLGVSSEKLEALILSAKEAGAWGAKLSGAGGGDCMIALASDEKRKAVEDAITVAGGQVMRVTTHATGVRLETTDNQKELFIVVDKDDNIIGYKTRYECHHDKTLIHRGVGLLIFDKDGRVLLQKRSFSKDTNPGFWADSVGGHVVTGESYEEAIQREMKEELRIAPLVVFHSKFILSCLRETEMNVLFTAVCDGPFHPDSTEISQVAFFSKNELPRKLLSGEVQLTEFAQEALKRVGFL